jgi:hypothetical protein
MNKRGAYQRKAQNIENVEARHALLEAGLLRPKTISKTVAKSLGGQRAFCSLGLQHSKIQPISLNTLKSLAANLYSQKEDANGNGFAYLDAMRVRLNLLIEETPRGRSIEAASQRRAKREADLIKKIREVELQNIRRSKAYFDLYSKLRTFLKDSEIEDSIRIRLFHLLEKHDALYGSLFNPTGGFSNAESVVQLTKPI